MIAEAKPGFIDRLRGMFSVAYEASEPNHKRRDPGRRIRSSDDATTEGQRRQLINNASDLNRNFSVAAWAIRKHLDYVSSFTLQARTPNPEFNRQLESFVASWSKPKRFDVGKRHGLRRFIRMAEARRVMDGDVFLVKQRTGQLQAIEADRVRTPDHKDDMAKGAEYAHGIRLGRGGTMAGVSVHKRSIQGSGYTFEKEIRAANVCQLAYWDGFDSKRGISPLSAAINDFQDVREVRDYAKAKAKITQLFALAITRESDDTEAISDDYSVDFGKGPIKLDLDPGDGVDFLESKHPSTEFQAFLQTCLMAAMKSLDMPWSFYDESFTNFFGSRAALGHYLTSCKSKRDDLVELLDDITSWRLALAIGNGELILPAGMAFGNLSWEWVPAGVPWWDPLKDIKASVMAIEAGLTTRSRVVKEVYGEEWTDTIDKLAGEQTYAETAGVSLSVTKGDADDANDINTVEA